MTNICDMPTQTASQGFFSLMTYVNNNNCVDGILMPLIVLAIYFITAVVSFGTTREAGKSILIASFICLVLSIPLSIMGMFAPKYMYLILLSLGVGVVWKILENR